PCLHARDTALRYETRWRLHAARVRPVRELATVLLRGRSRRCSRRVGRPVESATLVRTLCARAAGDPENAERLECGFRWRRLARPPGRQAPRVRVARSA